MEEQKMKTITKLPSIIDKSSALISLKNASSSLWGGRRSKKLRERERERQKGREKGKEGGRERAERGQMGKV